jgi:histidine triad (HIT) family protein
MDIMPRCEGHTLVIPRAPVRTIFDASPDLLAACMRTVQKVGAAALKAFAADGMTLLQANESAGGQVVFHLHFHLMPRWEGRSLGPAGVRSEKPEVLAANAEKIRKALAA